MKRKNYFVLMLLAVLSLSFSSCVFVDSLDDDLVINTSENLCNKNWVDVRLGMDAKGKYQCEHTVRFNLNGTGYEKYVYRNVDSYNNVGEIYQIEDGLSDPEFRFNWSITPNSNSLYMNIILDNDLWDISKKFKDVQIRRNIMTGMFDGDIVTFYNRGY